MAANALASLVLDRFVSASSAEDAHSSLEHILEALQNNKLKLGGDDADIPPQLSPEMIWSDQDILNSLRHVLHTGKHKTQEMEVPVDEGASLVCKIYMEMVEQESNKSPLLEKDEALLECLIDVISSSSTNTRDETNNNNADDDDGSVIVSMYTRVLALQFLTKLCVKRPSLAQTQLLQAPNGLHRLGDLLQIDTEEIIRNEALLLAQVIAEWPSCAKIWMFSEVADQVILLAVEEGGLTKGNVMVQDCLDLLFKLWKHDPNLADLVFQSPVITDNLPRLLDLRRGTDFLNPPKKASATKKDDDLDDILKSASSSKEAEAKDDQVVIPRLTSAEEKVIEKTLDILALLLESDSLKQSVWNREKNLCSLLWELSLVSPPPPQVPYVCAVPSPQLQQRALETVALYFHDPKTMERHAGLDRLLYLVCTGGLGTTLEEKMGISQSALHVIRKTVSLESASEMLMYTLAPPMSMDEGQPPPPTVVHKLLNTVAENITPTAGIDADRRKVFLAGALGGLSIFLTDQTSREVMLRLTTTTTKSGGSPEGSDPNNNAAAAAAAAADDDEEDNTTTVTSSLIESILHSVGTMEEGQNPEDAFFSMTLLRFLCHWTVDTPAVVHTILSSNQSSLVLSALLGIKTKTQSHKRGVAVLGKLLLGLAMEYMGEDEEKCGGWTRASIMELISKKSGGVSKFTSTLEQFKSVRDFGNNMPWSVCELEFKVWSQWFADCVLSVRKRVVQELTGSGDGEDEDDDDEGMMMEGENSQVPASASGSARSLQKLVYQQSQEIDALQQTLQKANEQIKSQDHEISEYKRRVESAPSQLDNMLDEYSAKISELDSRVAKEVEEKNSIIEKNNVELKARDDQIAALKKELEESREREKEAREETDTLREEIESLSQAYTGLEQEYRQQQQQSDNRQQDGGVSSADTTTTTSEQQPGEQEQEGSQQQRAPEQQSTLGAGAGSTEISALRAENERLRTDAQAADQWMGMAVEKMKVLGQQNASLQAELLQARSGQAQPELQQQYQALQGEHQSLAQQHGQLQAHLDGLAKENHGLKLAIQEEQEHRMHLDQQLGGTAEELQSTTSALEENRIEFESRLGEMESNLENAETEINRLKEQLHEEREISAEGESQVAGYETDLAAKAEELERLNGLLEGQTADANALRMEVAQLRDQLNQQQNSALQGESDINANLEATLASKNAEVEKLRVALDGTAAEMRGLRAEVDKLRAQQSHQHQNDATAMDEATFAARQEVEDLKKALEAQNLEVDMQRQTHANEVDALNTSIGKLQQDMEAARAELENVRKHEQEEIYQRESRIRELEAKMNGTGMQTADESKERDAEIAELKAANDSAQEWMARAVDHHNMLSEQHARIGSENAALTAQIRELKEKVSSNEAALAQARAKEQEALGQASRLREAETSLLDRNSELERMQGELTLLQSQSSDFDQVSTEAEHLRSEVGTLNSSIEEQAAVVEKLQQELSSDKARRAALEEEITVLKANANKDSTGFAKLQEKVQTLDSALQEKTIACDQMSNEINTERESKTSLLNEVATLKEKSALLASEVEKLRNKSESLGEDNQKVTELFNQLQRAKEENTDLLRTQKDQTSEITRLGEEIATLRGSIGTALSQPSKESSAESFFAVGNSSGLSTGSSASAQPQSAQQLFSAPLQASGTVSAQELFSAAPPSAQGVSPGAQVSGIGAQEFFGAASSSGMSAQGFFAGGQSTSGGGNSVGGTTGNQAIPDAEKAGQIEQLQIQLNESRLELEKTRKSLAENESFIRERASALETTVQKLQEQLKKEEEEKASQVSKVKSLEEKNSELAMALETVTSATATSTSDAQSKQLQLELAESRTKLSEALARLEDDDNVVAQWEGRVRELEEEIAEQEESANAVIEQWQESCNSLEEKNKELMQLLDYHKATATYPAVMNGHENASIDLLGLQAELEETKASLATVQAEKEGSNDRILSLQAELEKTKAALVSSQVEKEGAKGNNREQNNNSLIALQAELEQTNAALVSAQAKLEDDDSVVVKWEERVAGLEAAIKDMEFQMREQEESANCVIARWQESCNALEEKNAELLSSLESFGPGELISKEALMALQERLRETEAALAKAKEHLKDDDDVVLRWQERVAELESASKDFAKQMGQQEEEAKTAIAEWQESCSTLHQQSHHLSEQLESAHEKEHQLGSELQETQKALEDAKASLREDEISLAKMQERVSELEGTVKDLQAQLCEQEKEADGKIGQWQASCNELEEKNSHLAQQVAESTENENTLQGKLEETQRALDEAKHKLKDDEESLVKGQERVSELEGAVKNLEVQLIEQEEETKGVIAKWQKSCTALEDQNKKLNEQLQASNHNGEKLDSDLQEVKRGLDEAEKRIKDDEDVLTKWQDRVSELEATVSELQAQLSEQETEAESAIAQWQESCSSLENQKSELARKLETSSEIEGSMKRKMEETQKALDEAKDNLRSDEDAVVKWQERVTELESVIKDLETQLAEQEEEADKAIEVWQQNWTTLEERNAELVVSMELATEQNKEAVATMQQKLDETETALAASMERVANTDENTVKLAEQIKVLESAEVALKEKMKAQAEEAETAAAQWQQSLILLEEKNAELGTGLNDAKEKLESANRMGNDSQKALVALRVELEESKRLLSETTEKLGQEEQRFQAQITELEATVSELDEQLNTQEEEANTVIEQWEQSYKSMEEQNEELSVSLDNANSAQQALQAELDQSKDALSEARAALDEGNPEGVVADLQAKIEELERELVASEEEASSAVAQWQETVKSVEASKKQLTEELEKSSEAQQSMETQINSLKEKAKEMEDALIKAHAKFNDEVSSVKDLQQKLHIKEEELRVTQEKLDSLQSELQEKEASLEDLSERAEEDELVVKEWEKRTGELEAELEERENEASDAIAQWQDRCAQLEKEKNELSRSLEAAQNRGKELADENDSLESSQAQLADSVDALTAEKARANDLKEQLAELESMVNLLQQRLLDSEKGSTSLREQIAENESMVNLLQQRLLDSEKGSTSLREQIAENDSMVNLMQQRLLDSEKDASAARDRLQEACQEYDTKTGDLSAKLEGAQSKIESLESALQNNTGNTADLEAKVMGLEEEMKGKDKEMADAVAEWQKHCVDLESKNTELLNKLEAITKDSDFEGSPEEHIAELESQIVSLEQEIEEAGGVVSSWQESYQLLETRNGELESELAERLEEIESLQSTPSGVDGELKAELDDLKSKLAASETVLSALQDLESRCASKEEELLNLSNQLEMATKERDEALAKIKVTADDDSASMQDIPVDTDMPPSTPLTQDGTDRPTIQELRTKVKDLEVQVEQAKKERDTANAAMESMNASTSSLMQELEDSKTESEEVVNQWIERNKQLEAQVTDLEEQLEEQHNQAAEAIGSWESRCSELQKGLGEIQLELDNCKAELVTVLKVQIESHDKLLSSHIDSYESDMAMESDVEISVEVMRNKIAEKQLLVSELLSNKERDINTLFTEMEQIKANSQESQAQAAVQTEATLALNSQIEDLRRQTMEQETTINHLRDSLALEAGVEFNVETLEHKISSLEQQIEKERLAKEEVEAQLFANKDKLSHFVLAESQVRAELDEAVSERNKLRESQVLFQSQLEEAEAKNIKLKQLEIQVVQVKSELDEARAENSKLQEKSLAGEMNLEGRQLQEKLDQLQSEKDMLEQEVGRLSNQTTVLQDELQDANNAVQVYVAKEVSDKATAMAAHALREQLHEIRKQADADRAAYAKEKDARVAAEGEVERLRTDLFALVDISEQENEMYGVAALTIKAADKIHRKERSEITELRKSLTRALDELRTCRGAERDAEERAAKACHHVVACEQELTAAKSDMKYLIETMDQMRQDESSRRASLEHRIRTLENDHDVMRRFHSSETDSLRSELTQAVLERDRTLQMLKDSEKNNAAMVYAASKEHSVFESPEAELAKLRIEKAQLLIAAAEEGARTERRLREVIATEVSSAEADVLVERERRLAAEAASENMKLLVVELQKDVQAYREDTNMGALSPRKAVLEQENERLRQEISGLNEDTLTLRGKLDAAVSAQENANYQIEKLEAECRIAQASSNRLDREIKFHSEVQAELNRMRASPMTMKTQVAPQPVEDNEKKEDDLRTVELYDKIHEQAEAMQRAREVHQALQVEHEDLLALLAQQEEIKRSLENALARAQGQTAVDAAIREAEQSSIALYGQCVRVSSNGGTP